MKKLKIYFLIILTLVFSLTACSVNSLSVGSVNGEKIDLNEYKYVLYGIKQQMESKAQGQNVENFWNTEFEGKKAIDVAKDTAFDEMTALVLITQVATKQGITIDENDKKQINSQMGQYVQSMGGKAGFEKALKERGITEKQLTTLLERQIYREKYLKKLESEDERFKFTDEKLKEYYLKEKIKAKHILFSTVDQNRSPLPKEQIDAKKKKADETLLKIKSGEDFDKLMNELSEDPGLQSYPSGYVFGKGEMVPPFEAAAYALKIGEVSEIVTTDFGYHIIKRVEFNFDQNDFDQTKENIKQKLSDDIFKDIFEQLKKQASIKKDDAALKKIK